MKLTSLAELGDLYTKVTENKVQVVPTVSETAMRGEVLLTDATQYLPEGVNKPGQAMGGGPGAGKNNTIEPLAKKTGPSGLKGNNFKEVDKIEDPGSDEKVMKKELEGKEEASENEHQDDAAKNTTPKEKVEDLVAEEHKYNYKPKFTMSKPKFDQLYEAALKRAPFTEDTDAEMEEAGVMPADDMAADAPEVTPGEDLGGEEETTVTITLDKELAKKLHDVLMGVLGSDEEQHAGEEDVIGGDEEVEDVVAEEVEAEDEGHPLHNMKKGKPDNPKGSNQVSDLKVVKHSVEKGSPKSEPTPKEEKGDNAKLQGKSNKVGSGTVATPGKKMFE